MEVFHTHTREVIRVNVPAAQKADHGGCGTDAFEPAKQIREKKEVENKVIR